MNKYARAPLFGAATIIAFLFLSCSAFSDFGIPETVSVKSNAAYVGALGQKYYDLAEKFGDDFIKDLEKDAGGDVYKYIPNPLDNTLTYLLHKKVYDVPLDPSKYIQNMKLDDSLADGMSFSKDINLPEIKKTVEIALPIGADTSTSPFPFDIPINFVLDPAIKSATIGVGAVTARAEGLGATLEISNFTLTGVKTSGGGDFTKDDFGDVGGAGNFLINKKLDLHDAKLVIPASQIKATGQIRVSSGQLASASKLLLSVQIEKLSDATADLSNVGKFVMDETTPNKTQLPAEMVAYVKNINFGVDNGSGVYYKSDKDGNVTTTKGLGKGIKFKAVNSFPAGNDIVMTVTSTTFGINSTDAIEAKANETAFDKSIAEFGDIAITSAIHGDKDDPKYINFSVSLSDAQSFMDLEMGKTYKIAVSEPAMLFDWDKINVDFATATPVEDKADLSDFSIDELMSEVDGEIKKLADNCDFVSVPVYFLVQKPKGDLASIIGDVTIDGKVFLTYTDSSSAAQTEYIMGDGSSTEEMKPCDAVAWPASGATFTKKFETKDKDYSFMKEMAPVLNGRPNDLAVNYSMSISGSSACDLYKAYLDDEAQKDSTSIAIEMAAVIPFKLNVSKSTDLDIFKIASMDMDDQDDLMWRDSVSDTETYAKYSGAISYMSLNYNFINAAIDGFNAKVTVDDRHTGEPNASRYSGIFREIQITGHDTSDDVITFTSDEIKASLTHFFMPKMTMTVPTGQISLRRTAIESPTSLGISPVVILQLNDNAAVDITDIIKK
ncbi:MAG: hypothetical protein J6V90_02790 [Treponema sp.]|nr:hypothetical protein [Treponema sp.]